MKTCLRHVEYKSSKDAQEQAPSARTCPKHFNHAAPNPNPTPMRIPQRPPTQIA
ncbi:hypothetical protein A1F94_013449 [Pyrenophora tritici-repentis]|uniref:Uncharacterized protein n=1 Tax=Pyrenophora tritici-repentis TaxID=45151 RepID=A0A922N1M8_9PLEO|nr:hypothetical protein A1F94_013449 [Pyrenophora tritici-repentis]KAI1509404.1 hypothetical protein Ptr86124_011484 [Pyrenophora tritici-repentis]KAI1671034.1 hypothetical protein L13192_04391 [Pyrenophora tritici-repentis]KAI1684777.1 hypothetical protein KJE20_05061 [Pyrenophora tritici-repentis]